MEDEDFPTSSDQNFTQLSSEFEQVLAEMPSSVTVYRQEFENLFNTLRKAHESEERLIRRGKEISTEINASQEQIAQLKNDENDAFNYKKRLQLDIEVAWAQVAESRKLEAEKQGKLSELRSRISVLKDQINNGSEWSEDQELVMSKLKRQKLDYTCELESKTTSLNQLRVEVNCLYDEFQSKEQETNTTQEEINSLTAEIRGKREQIAVETHRKQQLERELRNLKHTIEGYKLDAREKDQRIQDGERDLKQKELHLRETRGCMEKYLREYELLGRKEGNLDHEINEQRQMNNFLQNQLQQLELDIKHHHSVLIGLSKDCQKTEQFIVLTKEKIQVAEEEKVKSEQAKDEAKQQINQLMTMELETERKQGEVIQKQNDDLTRERELLRKMCLKSGESTQEIFDMLKVNENTKKNILNEIQGYHNHVKKQREMVQQLIADRERYEKDAEIANKKYLTAMEEVKLQEVQVAALQKKIVEGETKLKQQLNLYEAVRSDRNLYSKNLIESQKEISEMKRRFKIMKHQIEQLKEEITSKDHALVKEHFDHHKVDKEKEKLKNELTRIKKQIQSSEQIIQNQDQELTKLTNIIQEADEERQRQVKEYGSVVNDRDNLRNQLIQRNTELHTLYEKLKIQSSTLQKGEYQFKERCDTINRLQEKVAQLQQNNKQAQNQTSDYSSLKEEIYKLESEVLEEQRKVKALTEELERPLNVHRWRKLEGSDPERYDMIRKIQTLQKRLIHKTEQVNSKDVLIQEKEKLYFELKRVLARQPGPEVAEQLKQYQQHLKEKHSQRKSMEKELQMYRHQVEEYKRDIAKIQMEMDKIKKQWFKQMLSPDQNHPIQELPNSLPPTKTESMNEPFDQESHRVDHISPAEVVSANQQNQ